MTEETNLRKLQKIELEILKKTIALCEAYGLRYYLLGGTFLGAVRHQGFIPWDDDIDIGMPRPDFERFCKLAEQAFQKPYGFVSFRNNAEHIYFHPRIYDYNSKVIDRSGVKEKETFAWIDIFPLDGMPSGKRMRKLHGLRLLFLRMLFMYSQFDDIVNVKNTNRVWYEKLLIALGKVIKFDKILNKRKRMEAIDKALRVYDFDSSAYVGNFMGAYKMKEIFPKRCYQDISLYNFEGLKLPAPKCYDFVLKQMYGDYMTPPEKDQQNKHRTEVTEVR